MNQIEYLKEYFTKNLRDKEGLDEYGKTFQILSNWNEGLRLYITDRD